MRDVTIRSNTATTRGGGLFNQGSADLAAVAFIENQAALGGGVNHAGGAMLIQGCAIHANHASDNGGGVRAEGTGLEIYYNMIANNTANGPGEGVFSNSGVSVNAIRNWWGSASGPYHPDDNPEGKGNSVSGDSIAYLVRIEMLELTTPTPNPATHSQGLVLADAIASFFSAGASPLMSVQFSRSGANPGGGLVSFAGAPLRATHHWTGLNPGTDEVVGEVVFAGVLSGLISQSVTLEWTGEPVPDEIFLDRFEQP